ncbi:FKBP12-associated protein [Apophysomyces ossiformis]|uniref:FKBP12-associated protein n=1 Tax=Apophysomyces ossiformis TaxID=679940 RepID=A0A8H7ET78_9FUNG|nr:FKBP12-associated protein [Apophysomyces ossiformis]
MLGCGQNSLSIPCNATADSSGSKQTLECNDFCAKVERNRKLAMALDINREDGAGEVPSADDMGYYDDSLRDFYLENPGWCKQAENMLLNFVQSNKPTLYCKPMRSAFRRFIHRYCVHFNVATEAVDPEPQRSVVIRKTIGDCRIPPILLSKAAYDPAANRPPVLQTPEVISVVKTSRQPVNALYLSDLVFGLTQFELDAALRALLEDTKFVTRWMNESDAVVIPTLSNEISIEEKENIVWKLKKTVKSALVEATAARVDCCWIDQTGVVTWSEKPAQKNITTEKTTSSSRGTNTFNALLSVGEDNEWMLVGGDTKKTDDAWAEETSQPQFYPSTNLEMTAPPVHEE